MSIRLVKRILLHTRGNFYDRFMLQQRISAVRQRTLGDRTSDRLSTRSH